MKGRRRELWFSRGCRLQILVIEGGSLGGGKFAGWPSDLSISRSPKCY